MVCNSCASGTTDTSNDRRWRRALWIALAVNDSMFAAMMVVGTA